MRKLDDLHRFDCLRANKSLAAWGIEGRVPFLDPSIACSTPTALRWDAAFRAAADPSGRAVGGVHHDGYEGSGSDG